MCIRFDTVQRVTHRQTDRFAITISLARHTYMHGDARYLVQFYFSFINDLDDNISSNVLKFTDDTKLFREHAVKMV